MPTTAQRVVASLQPLPAFLRQHADEVAKVIAEAKQSGGAVQSTAAFPASFYLATELKAPAVPVPSAAVARFQGACTLLYSVLYMVMLTVIGSSDCRAVCAVAERQDCPAGEQVRSYCQAARGPSFGAPFLFRCF